MKIAKKLVVKKPRELTFEWVRKSGKTSAGGVYKLWFGDKFYIGRSRCLVQRMSSHLNDLNARLSGKRIPSDPTLDYYQKVIKHLKKNKDIVVVRIEIVRFCKTDDELVANEQKQFDKHINDEMCLNFGFVATPYKYLRSEESIYPRVEFNKPIAKRKPKEKSDDSKFKDKYKNAKSSSEKIRLLRKRVEEIEKMTIRK